MAPAEPHAIPFRPKGEIPEFKEEREGWKGYIEWEKYPEKKKQVEKIMAQYDFPDPPQYQLGPLPDTNPILTGERWKQYHHAVGLGHFPDISWDIVKKEKAEDMIHVLQFPYNGETPRASNHGGPFAGVAIKADTLYRNASWETEFTDNKDHFVRNHGGIPEIDEDKYTLDITGLVNNPQTFTLHDLKTKFPHQSNVVSLQCSGTRRIEQIAQYPGDGDELINAPWGEGAIGTARWTGVSLKKVIKYCGGLKEGAGHLEFFGADTYFKKGKVYNYVVSVPWRKVKLDEVLLAWEMNGEPLPKIHGFPLRTLVFGYIGARSTKWLTEVRAIPHESAAPVQRREYIYYTPQIGKQNAKYSNGFSIQEMPVSSAIMTPKDMDQIVHDGSVTLRGWAYSGGRHWPVRVEVSSDGGSVWYEVPYEKLTKKYFHAWRLWEIEMPVDAEGWLEFCVRTWDNSCNTQPTYVRSAWNWDLHVTSSCHRIKIYSMNRSRPATAARLKALEEKGVPIVPITHPIAIDLESDEEYERNMAAQGGRDPEE